MSQFSPRRAITWHPGTLPQNGTPDLRTLLRMTPRMQQPYRRSLPHRALRMLGGYAGALIFASILCTAYALYDMHRLSSYTDNSFKAQPFSNTLSIWTIVFVDGFMHSSIQSALFIILFEWKAIRDAGYYIAAGAVVGILAWLTFYNRLTKPTLLAFENYLLLGVVAGAGAGLVYWWIAGRKAGKLGHA